MSLVRFQSVSVSFGHQMVLDEADLVIEKGQRIALIGRNGEGKSTLLKLINQELDADSGVLQFKKGINIQRLSQTVPEELHGRVFEIVAAGLGDIGQLLSEYYAIEHAATPTQPDTLVKLHHQLDEMDGWALFSKVETVLSKMGLQADHDIQRLSGGMRRRVLLARALLTEPDLLLLDEPTNHLDIEAIQWLERLLSSYQGAFVLVTHDRSFLRATTNAIVEVDRGKLHWFEGNYDYYVRHKEQMALAEEKANSEFDKKLAQEEAWIRQGIKARRTRNEGRVRALKALRKERLQRRDVKGTMAMSASSLEASGKLVFEAEHISFERAGKKIINDFSALVMRGDKIGIVGPNGCGKTTLLKLLLGELQPSSGKVKQGTQLKIAYFDQMRTALELDKTALENVGQGSTMVDVFGKSQHVISYLQQFLFTPERAQCAVSNLSGGEQNRLLLAKLFTLSANLMILDEPTNDLDIESLEVLEAFLVDYPGTLLIVSHDRTFLENVVTASWVYQGEGCFSEFPGGFTPYQAPKEESAIKQKETATNKRTTEEKKVSRGVKLSFNEQRELQALPAQIEKLEQQLASIQAQLADPALYQSQSAEEMAQLGRTLKEQEEALEHAYLRWETLEAKR